MSLSDGAAASHLGLAGPSPRWASPTDLIAVRSGSPAPLGFQDGLYRITAR